MPAPTEFELIEDRAALQRLVAEWRRLLDAAARPEPMLAPSWIVPWWDHYGSNRTLAVGTFRENGSLIGLALMCRRRFVYRPGIVLRRLEFMGSSGGEDDGVCGEYLAPIAISGREAVVAEAFAQAVSNNSFGAWDELVLEQMDGESVITAELSRALRRQHARVAYDATMHASYLTLAPDWETYLRQVDGKKRRNSIRRAWKDFVAWAGEGNWRLHRAGTAEEVHQGMRILAQLHEERWQAEGEPGAFTSERFSRFHVDHAIGLLERGQLDLLWLTVGNTPVAAQYSFVAGGKVYFYQSGRKIGAPPKVRLGIVMCILAIQDAMARGLEEYDFLGGDSPYKRYFTSTTRPLVNIRVARPSLREATRRTLQTAAPTVRAALALARTAFARVREAKTESPKPPAEQI